MASMYFIILQIQRSDGFNVFYSSSYVVSSWFQCHLWHLQILRADGFNVIYGFTNTMSRGLQCILWFLKYFEPRVSIYLMVSQIL